MLTADQTATAAVSAYLAIGLELQDSLHKRGNQTDNLDRNKSRGAKFQQPPPVYWAQRSHDVLLV